MRLSLSPFPGCAHVHVPLTPLACALVAGKFTDCAPPFVPDCDWEITVFVDLPGVMTPLEGLEWLGENIDWVQRRAAEWLISPVCLN